MASRTTPSSQQLQQTLAGDALGTRRLCVELAELALQHAEGAARFLLLAQLLAVVGQARPGLLAVLARRVGAALDGTLVGEALLALEEQLLALSAALAALRVGIPGHVLS